MSKVEGKMGACSQRRPSFCSKLAHTLLASLFTSSCSPGRCGDGSRRSTSTAPSCRRSRCGVPRSAFRFNIIIHLFAVLRQHGVDRHDHQLAPARGALRVLAAGQAGDAGAAYRVAALQHFGHVGRRLPPEELRAHRARQRALHGGRAVGE